jgi:hypothetical protein
VGRVGRAIHYPVTGTLGFAADGVEGRGPFRPRQVLERDDLVPAPEHAFDDGAVLLAEVRKPEPELRRRDLPHGRQRLAAGAHHVDHLAIERHQLRRGEPSSRGAGDLFHDDELAAAKPTVELGPQVGDGWPAHGLHQRVAQERPLVDNSVAFEPPIARRRDGPLGRGAYGGVTAARSGRLKRPHDHLHGGAVTGSLNHTVGLVAESGGQLAVPALHLLV